MQSTDLTYLLSLLLNCLCYKLSAHLNDPNQSTLNDQLALLAVVAVAESFVLLV